MSDEKKSCCSPQEFPSSLPSFAKELKDLERHSQEPSKSYTPVLFVFLISGLMSWASIASSDSPFSLLFFLERFMAFLMCSLALIKCQDLSAFAQSFSRYDFLAQACPPYARVYPFIELIAGLTMLSGFHLPLVSVIIIITSNVNALSIIKNVYIQGRTLSCACVGGNRTVPLGALSLTENIMMIAMAFWMLVR